MEDIRWKQRFQNFEKALNLLESGILEYGNTEIILLKEGIIQRFEFTHELAWKVLKDFLENAGMNQIFGSKDATRFAFKEGIITQGEEWMNMIKTRNETVHNYTNEIIEAEFQKIVNVYLPLLLDLRNKLGAYL